MSQHRCGVCGSGVLRRSSRTGVMETFVLSLFGYFPWRCRHCQARTMLRSRGEGQFVQMSPAMHRQQF